MKIPYKKGLNTILVLLMILITANPYISHYHLFFLSVIFVFLILRNHKNLSTFLNIGSKHLLILLFVLTYELIHALIFNRIHMLNTLRLTALMYLAYLTIKVVNIRFISIFINLIYYLTILSLVLYPIMLTYAGPVLMNIADSIFGLPPSKLGYYAPTLILYTFDANYFSGQGEIYRNAGFTWEAGAFANYINIALLLNLFCSNKEISPLNKKNFIFILGIISTFSTTGYIVLFVIVIVYLYNSRQFNIWKWAYIVIFLGFSIYLYKETPFLMEKVNTQYELGTKGRTRFSYAILDLNDWAKRPLFGWSRDVETLFGDNNEQETHRPNGITNLLRTYGAVYFLIFFILIYYSLKKVGRKTIMKSTASFAMFFIIVLLLCAFSQTLFDKFFFKSMIFWGDYFVLNTFMIKNLNKNFLHK